LELPSDHGATSVTNFRKFLGNLPVGRLKDNLAIFCPCASEQVSSHKEELRDSSGISTKKILSAIKWNLKGSYSFGS